MERKGDVERREKEGRGKKRKGRLKEDPIPLFSDFLATPMLFDASTRHLLLHRESKKGCHPNHGYNFVNS